jgi:hypothetical protein
MQPLYKTCTVICGKVAEIYSIDQGAAVAAGQQDFQDGSGKHGACEDYR